MNYKLSNIATKEQIKDFTKLKFKYPHLYKSKRKINGLKEQTICLITMDSPNKIRHGIWGILPQNYNEDWKKFQHIKHSLHTNKKEIKENILFKGSLQTRRCLLIVTGFYTHKLINGEIENYLVEKKDQKPFYLAGVYNTTYDGFTTCTVINTKATKKLNTQNNLYNVMPLQIPQILKNVWLNKSLKYNDIN